MISINQHKNHFKNLKSFDQSCLKNVYDIFKTDSKALHVLLTYVDDRSEILFGMQLRSNQNLKKNLLLRISNRVKSNKSVIGLSG